MAAIDTGRPSRSLQDKRQNRCAVRLRTVRANAPQSLAYCATPGIRRNGRVRHAPAQLTSSRNPSPHTYYDPRKLISIMHGHNVFMSGAWRHKVAFRNIPCFVRVMVWYTLPHKMPGPSRTGAPAPIDDGTRDLASTRGCGVQRFLSAQIALLAERQRQTMARTRVSLAFHNIDGQSQQLKILRNRKLDHVREVIAAVIVLHTRATGSGPKTLTHVPRELYS